LFDSIKIGGAGVISSDTALIIAENIMMSDINKGNKRITFVKPDYPDIHIDAEFKQIVSSLQTFYPKRRMQGIFCKEQEL
jgi:hypothetical protein